MGNPDCRECGERAPRHADSCSRWREPEAAAPPMTAERVAQYHEIHSRAPASEEVQAFHRHAAALVRLLDERNPDNARRINAGIAMAQCIEQDLHATEHVSREHLIDLGRRIIAALRGDR